MTLGAAGGPLGPEKRFFRDPSGIVFERDGVILRQINASYQRHYDALRTSGLYDRLVSEGSLLPHEEVDEPPFESEGSYKVIRPRRVPFISYPWEWCFSQLQDAAALTLRVQSTAAEYGMLLKDCTPFNVQFIGCRPVFIDTLSFEVHEDHRVWPAYRQACEYFVGPLALMAYVDPRLSQLLRVHTEGIPLDLLDRLLPLRSWLNLGLAMHIKLHAAVARRAAGVPARAATRTPTAAGESALLASLQRAVSSLRLPSAAGTWEGYYTGGPHPPAVLASKERLVAGFLRLIRPGLVLDLGANTGHFSMMAAKMGAYALALDGDHGCVEAAYRRGHAAGESGCLPIWMDLRNPSSGQGWAGRECLSLQARGPADAVFALGLLHHLMLGPSPIPLIEVAEFLGSLAPWLAVEFIPPDDPQALTVASSRSRPGVGYTFADFERSFQRHFTILRNEPIAESQRRLVLLRRSPA